MARPTIATAVLPENQGAARQAKRIKELVAAMAPKFDVVRSVTVGVIPVKSQTVYDLYGDYLELAYLVRTHPALAD